MGNKKWRALERDNLTGRPTVLAIFVVVACLILFLVMFVFGSFVCFISLLKSMVVGLIGLHGVIVAKAVKLVSKNVYGLAQIQFLATVEPLALGHLDNLKYATRTIAQVRYTF